MSLCSLTIFILDKTLTYHHNEFKKSHHMSSNWFAHITAHKKVNKKIWFCSVIDVIARADHLTHPSCVRTELSLISFWSCLFNCTSWASSRLRDVSNFRMIYEKKTLILMSLFKLVLKAEKLFEKNSDCMNFKNVILCNGRSHCSLKIHIYYIDWWKWTVLFWCIHAQDVHLTYVACKTLVLHLNNI